MSNKTIIRDLTAGNVFRQLVWFAIPFVISNALQQVYTIVDMIIVGQFVGAAGLAAVSTSGEIMSLGLAIGMGFSTAGQTLIAQFVGRGERDAIQKTIGNLFSLVTILAVVTTVIGCVFTEPLLRIMNVQPEAWQDAYDYAFVCFLGMFFIFGYNTVSAVLRGMGDSKRPCVFIAIATVFNIVFDLLFVGVMDMSALGAALATVLGQGLSFVASIVYLYRRRDAFCFDFKPRSFALEKKMVVALTKVGLPMIVQMTALNVSQMVVTAIVNSFGVVAAAVTGVGNKICSVMSICSNSLGAGGASMVGQNLGANKHDRVVKIYWDSFYITLVISLIMSAIVLIWPEQVFGLFNSDPEVLAMSHSYSIIAAISFLGFAVRTPSQGLISGLGFATYCLIMGLMDGVVARIGLSLLFCYVFDMGIFGLWLGGTIAGYVTGFMGHGYYMTGKWRTRKLAIE